MLNQKVLKIEDIFGDLKTIETNRLILRKISLEDANDIFEYSSDPEICRYTLWEHHKSINETINYLKFIINNYKSKKIENWGMFHKENKKLIGTCGFYLWDTENYSASIHFAMSLRYSGKGLMTETVKNIFSFGFETMKLNRIEAACMTENVASERVMHKTGMKFEGIKREAVYAKGRFIDLKIYSILKNDFNDKTDRI